MPAILPPHSVAQTVAAQSGGDLVRDDLGTAALFLAVAGWLVFAVAYTCWGRDQSPRRRRGDALDQVQLPEDPPAVAHALHEGGTTDHTLLGAVVLDLARRGYLEVVEGQRIGPAAEPVLEWTFHRRDTPRGDLRPYENALYTRLFAEGNDVSASSVILWAEANRQQARVFLERVRRYVAADLREEGYLEHPRRLPVGLNLVASGLVILVGLAALVSGAVIGLAAVASGAFQVSRTRQLRRHALIGSGRAREWAEVAHALEEVATIEEPPASNRDGWERCLVYAAALGATGKFLAGLEAREARLFRSKDFAAWYQSNPDGPRFAGIPLFVEWFGRALVGAAEGPAPAPVFQGSAVQGTAAPPT